MYSQSMFLAKIRKILKHFYCQMKIFNFYNFKNRCILHGHVFVMIISQFLDVKYELPHGKTNNLHM